MLLLIGVSNLVTGLLAVVIGLHQDKDLAGSEKLRQKSHTVVFMLATRLLTFIVHCRCGGEFGYV